MISSAASSTKEFSNKALFEYWYNRVEFRNEELIAHTDYIKTAKLRHECTNYDELWKSPAVLQLPRLEQDRMVAVIKYVCTSRVLKLRATRLREQMSAMAVSVKELEAERSLLGQLIQQFKQALFGKDQEIKQLQARIFELETENEAIRAESEESKAYATLLEEFEKLQKEYDKLQQHRQKLAKNNQSLGGRVAHTNRFRRERDEAREILAEHEEQIAELTKYNQELKAKNQKLTEQLRRVETL